MKLNLVRRADFSFIPSTDEDMEKALKIKKGTVVEANIKVLRNYKLLRKFFAMINTAWEFLTEAQQNVFSNSKDAFRHTLTASAGYCDLVQLSPERGAVLIPKSIAFDKMTEAEFEKLYDAVVDEVFKRFLSDKNKDAFFEAMKNF